MNSQLANEFAIIDAEHAIRQRMAAEIELLRILLQDARGCRVSLHDKFKLQEIAQRHPAMAATHGVYPRKKL